MKHREHKIAFLLCSLTCLSSVFAGDENTSNTAPDKGSHAPSSTLTQAAGERTNETQRLLHVNEDFALCAKKHHGNNSERLKCFDSVLAIPIAATGSVALPTNSNTSSHDLAVNANAPLPDLSANPDVPVPAEPVRDKRSYLSRAWNLDNHPRRDQSSLDRLQPHKLSYLIVRETSNTNTQPSSPAVGRTGAVPYNIDALEAKFQLSFKTDIGALENIDLFGLKTVRLWGAYTQQSHWQVFNTRSSSPFRETNYEPELIAAFGTGNDYGWKLLNLGFVHQSNGRTNPESRSWNRLYAQGGWEWNNNTSLLARGWWRIPENALKDDNPDIVQYIGRSDMTLRWEPDSKSQAIALLLRNNLNLSANRGFMQLDWSMPVALGHAARLHTQISSGYGESLIDYNHKQTTFGMGISFREW